MIAPLSTLPNWLKEANRFCPSLDAFILYGTKDVRYKLLERLKKVTPHWDLCITNYETCRRNKGIMQRVKWNFVVLDEGHKIKNEKTQTHKAISDITSNHRLILTGTPLNVRIDLHLRRGHVTKFNFFCIMLERFTRALGVIELHLTGCILQCRRF